MEHMIQLPIEKLPEGVYLATSDDVQGLIDKIRQLLPQRLAEVEDFVDFLRSREDGQRLTQVSAKMAEASFAAVWNNDEDAAYDRM